MRQIEDLLQVPKNNCLISFSELRNMGHVWSCYLYPLRITRPDPDFVQTIKTKRSILDQEEQSSKQNLLE